MKKIHKNLASAAFLLGVATVAFSAQRTVLVEESTSSTCPPCAAMNPIIEAAINGLGDQTVVQIAYHVWWPSPGNDPMFLLNQAEVQDRIGYYSINAAPDLISDGANQPDQPWSNTSLTSYWQTAAAVPTPVIFSNTDFSVDLSTGNLTITGSVDLEPGGQVPNNLKLRMAITERETIYTSPPGTNGETHFANTFRKFVTGSAGTTIDLTTGSYPISEVVTAANVNPEWHIPELAVVFFVQDDATKEVYQAKVQNISGLPDYSVTNTGASSEYLAWQQLYQGFTFDITNNSGASDTYDIDFTNTVPNGWTVEYDIDGTIYTGASQITLADGASKTVSMNVTPDGDGGSAEFEFEVTPASFPAYKKHVTYNALSGVDVLVVDDDAGSNYEIAYTDAISSTIAHGVWRRSDAPVDAAFLSNFSAVIWFTGDDFTSTLDDGDLVAIQSYLDNGGNLFISGQDIGYDIVGDSPLAGGTAFMQNYLGANYVSDDANVNFADGVAGDPISDGFISMSLNGGNGASNNNYPDVISSFPLSTPVEIFNYTGGVGLAGLRRDTGTYKVVYLAFPFETIASQNDRTEIMGNILSWFGLQPNFTLSSTDITVNDVELVNGQANHTYTLTISNSGGGSFDVTNWAVTGGSSSNFQINNQTPPVTLNAGESVDLELEFSATNLGNYYANLQIDNTLTGSTYIPIFFQVITVGIEDEINVPVEYTVSQNYPNPFNPTTNINYTLKENGNVKITVFNSLGQQVKTLVNDFKNVGIRHSVTWDGTDSKGNSVSSGTYFYKIESGSFTQTRKMLLVK